MYMMKVILLQSVRKLGRKFDEVNVKTGYAQNFLFPQKVAVPATEPFLSDLLSQKTNQQAEIDDYKAKAIAIFTEVSGKTISIKVKANETGGLYSSLGEKEVAKIASKEFNIDIPEDLVLMKNPIKALGEYDIDCVYDEKNRDSFILQVIDEQKKASDKKKEEMLEDDSEVSGAIDEVKSIDGGENEESTDSDEE